MFTTCGLGVVVRFQNQTMFTIKQHLYNDTSNPSICSQYYLLEINFHKGTYSQHVETLRVGEEFFSVVDGTAGCCLGRSFLQFCWVKHQPSSRARKTNWHSNSNGRVDFIISMNNVTNQKGGLIIVSPHDFIM